MTAHSSRGAALAMQKEISLLVHLRHPNIVSIMGICVPKAKSGCPLLVMELMDRGSLHDLIHNESVELDGAMIFSILKVNSNHSPMHHIAQ